MKFIAKSLERNFILAPDNPPMQRDSLWPSHLTNQNPLFVLAPENPPMQRDSLWPSHFSLPCFSTITAS
jgi:hypothetical protein